MTRLRVAILGATGSIGSQALDVIDRFPDRFEVFGLLAGERALPREARFAIRAADPDAEERIEEMVTHPDCDLVLTAIPGARALPPTLAALRAGKVVALATKEVLVMAAPSTAPSGSASGASTWTASSGSCSPLPAAPSSRPPSSTSPRSPLPRR